MKGKRLVSKNQCSIQRLCWITLVLAYATVISYFISTSMRKNPEPTEDTASTNFKSRIVPDEVFSRALPPLVAPVKPFLGPTKSPGVSSTGMSRNQPAKIVPEHPPAPSRPLTSNRVVSSSVETLDGVTIAASLLTLAKLPSMDLKNALNKSVDDVFSLKVGEFI